MIRLVPGQGVGIWLGVRNVGGGSRQVGTILLVCKAVRMGDMLGIFRLVGLC